MPVNARPFFLKFGWNEYPILANRIHLGEQIIEKAYK